MCVKLKKTKDDNYIILLNGLCKGIIRSQYDKIKKIKVKTIAYSDSKTLTPEKLQENHEFNEKSNHKIIYYYIVDDAEYIINRKYKMRYIIQCLKMTPMNGVSAPTKIGNYAKTLTILSSETKKGFQALYITIFMD